MKRKTPQIKSGFVCSQKWEDMQVAKGGKHCEQCSKTVVDLRNMSKSQVFKLTAQEDELCGIYHPDQLATWNAEDPKRQLNLKPWIAAAGLMLGTSNAFSQSDANSQSLDFLEGKSLVEYLGNYVPEKPPIYEDWKKGISGMVVDKEGEFLPAAILRFKDTNIGCHADLEGNFDLSKDVLKKISKSDSLVVEYVGFKAMTFSVTAVPKTIMMEYDFVEVCKVEGKSTIQNVTFTTGRVIIERFPANLERRGFFGRKIND